jgi:uncharacterized protein YqgQ
MRRTGGDVEINGPEMMQAEIKKRFSTHVMDKARRISKPTI